MLSISKKLDPKDLDDFFLEDRLDFPKHVSDEKFLEIAKQHLLECRFFGLVERMKDSLFLLHYTFAWRPVHDVLKLNLIPVKNLDEKLTEDADRILEKRTMVDAKLYEFAQQIFDERYSQMIKDLKKKYNETSLTNNPPYDIVYELLEKHYNDHFEESRPKVQLINYTFNQALDGDGWHEREIEPTSKIIFRWSGPGKTSSIDLPLSREKDLKIQFHIIDYMAMNILESLQLKVNDNLIQLKFSHEKPRTKQILFEGIIPKTALKSNKKFTRLTFTINRTETPSKVNPNSTDERSLGFAMNWMKIYPAS